MSASYDLISVIDAVAQIKDHHVKLLAMGDGALREKFIAYSKKNGIVAEFTGKLPYSQMIERLKQCDIAVNPIHKGSAGSIINKVGDYAMAGLPVINTQECAEYRNLLDQYKAGINCGCENVNDIVNALKLLIDDVSLRASMGRNSLKLGIERFDRAISYKEIVKLFK